MTIRQAVHPRSTSARGAETTRARMGGDTGAARLGASFGFNVVALLAIAAWFGQSGRSWLLWIATGVVAGAIAGRSRDVWLAPVAVAAFYGIGLAVALLHDLGPFWILGAVVGTLLVGAGFVVGDAIAWRRDPLATARSAWAGLGHARHRLVVGSVLLVAVALSVYVGYVAIAAANGLAFPTKAFAHCWTPATRYGWEYEAINYDKADDLRIAALNPTMKDCSTPSDAGTAVVSSDGVRLAGWYVPAAADIGPSGPTIVIAPGWTSSKSEALKYAPVFHDDYNLVVVDLRDQGRSGEAPVTFGLREQNDVRAMIDWLVAEKDPSWIGAMGDSMGGISVLAEAGSDVRVRAVILDSTQGTIVAGLGNGLERENGQPGYPGAWAGVLAYSWTVGGDVTSVDPVRTIRLLGERPVLLIYSTSDVLATPAQAAEPIFHAGLQAGVPVELHYVSGPEHGKIVDARAEDWTRWALSFLDAARAP
jgi:X-Pro dipeptidyl-peptidase-like protein